MAGRFSYASAVKGSINTYKDLVIDMKDSYKYGWELERSVGIELEALIEERKKSEPKSREDHSMLLQRRSTSAPSIVVVLAT